VYNFIVLGIVPGTNLQITFQTWLDALGLILVAAVGSWLYFKYQPTLEKATVRAPLHARQLHPRA
jgi:hypothetical protein